MRRWRALSSSEPPSPHSETPPAPPLDRKRSPGVAETIPLFDVEPPGAAARQARPGGLPARLHPPISGTRRRVALTVAYDGRNFHGFAAQPGLRTVAGVLTDAIELTLRHEIDLTAAARTDRGVHALGQVVSFDVATDGFDAERLLRAVNKLCRPEIAVTAVTAVGDDFDARLSARSRRYRYRILNRAVHDPLAAGHVWHVADPLDLAALRLGADPLIGRHDFTSFCRRPRVAVSAEASSLEREVLDVAWLDDGDGWLRFEIEARAFCHQMVRSVVGTLVDMGIGRRRPGEMRGIISAQDRNASGGVAPPEGLCLLGVRYEGTSQPPGPVPDPEPLGAARPR